MRAFFTMWRRELNGYFLSPIAYVVTIFFLVVMGFSFWMLASVLSHGSAGVTVMNELFGSFFFWLTMLTVAPLLTMRLIAEEKRSGTIETLMTAPVSETAVVLSKFAGVCTFFIVMWLPTFAYAWVLQRFSSVMAPIDLGPMLGGYLGAFLVGAAYLALGLLCSALTTNQIVAAIVSFAMSCVAFFTGFLAFLGQDERMRAAGGYVSSVSHMLDFSRGSIDSRPVVLYVSATVFLLFVTIKVLEARRWK